ncbi:MAG: PEP-CTERM sorting domain-containing protein [Deltaproteobacteria bacterium]|nr:PEP-CTERM sorting domain-containing protein [Deltaproteobacteria bacterium]
MGQPLQKVLHHGIYHSAAHIRSIGIGDEDSGWIGDTQSVPEPSTILLVGTGLLGMIAFGRKRLNKKV